MKTKGKIFSRQLRLYTDFMIYLTALQKISGDRKRKNIAGKKVYRSFKNLRLPKPPCMDARNLPGSFLYSVRGIRTAPPRKRNECLIGMLGAEAVLNL